MSEVRTSRNEHRQRGFAWRWGSVKRMVRLPCAIPRLRRSVMRKLVDWQVKCEYEKVYYKFHGCSPRALRISRSARMSDHSSTELKTGCPVTEDIIRRRFDEHDGLVDDASHRRNDDEQCLLDIAIVARVFSCK